MKDMFKRLVSNLTGSTAFVFVYGTLMSECQNNPFLGSSELLGKYVTTSGFIVTTFRGIFPAITEKDGENKVKVKGELYKVSKSTLHTLDMIEQVPHLFKRKLITLDDFPYPVFAYILSEDILVSGLTDRNGDKYVDEENIFDWKKGLTFS